MFQTNAVEKIRAHILCAMTFFFENNVVYEVMWKNVERGRPQMTTTHAHCMLDASGYRHTHTGCVTLNIAFTAKIVMRNRLSDTVYSRI